MSIPSRVLLSLYLVLPFSLVFVLTDYYLFNQDVRKLLPNDPHSLPFFALFFHLPHIVGSAIILLDKEYVKFYRKPLLIGIPLIIASMTLLPLIVGVWTAAMLFVFVTIVHVVGQQMGVARMLLGKIKMADFYFWKFLSLPLWSLAGFLVLSGRRLSAQSVPLSVYVIAIIAYGIATFFVYRLCRESSNKIGGWYLISTHLMLALTACFIYYQYPFFAILCPRVVHDCTAFAFYIAHNQNRFIKTRSNLLFRLLAFSGIPIFILCPLTAIILTKFLKYSYFYFGTIFITFFILFHYLTEAITWKRTGLYREYVKIT